MRTLYLRNVPDEVAEDLAELAKRAGMSTSAFAVRELTKASRRAHNARIFDALPDLGFSGADAVAAIEAGRQDR